MIGVIFIIGLNSCGSGHSNRMDVIEEEYDDRGENSQSSIGASIVKGIEVDTKRPNEWRYSHNSYDNITMEEFLLLMTEYYDKWEREINTGNFEKARSIIDEWEKVKERYEDKFDIEDLYN